MEDIRTFFVPCFVCKDNEPVDRRLPAGFFIKGDVILFFSFVGMGKYPGIGNSPVVVTFKNPHPCEECLFRGDCHVCFIGMEVPARVYFVPVEVEDVEKFVRDYNHGIVFREGEKEILREIVRYNQDVFIIPYTEHLDLGT